MSDLLGRLTSPAVNHLDHPFWVSAVRHHQQRLGMHAMPPEFIRELTVIPQHFETDRKRPGLGRLLGRFGSSIERASGAAVRKTKDRLIGRAPSVGILHYAYLDYKNFRHRIADFSKARGCVLYVKDHDSALDAYIEKATSPIGMTIGALSEADSDALQGNRPNGVIIRLSDENIHRLPEVLLSVGNFISDNDPVLLCTTGIQGAFFQARFTLAGDLAREVATRVKGNVTVREFLMVGHRERLSIDYRVRKSFQLLLAGGFAVRIAVALVVFSSFCKLLYINLTKQPHAFIREDDVCTSATVLLEARWRSIALAQSVSGTIVRRES